MPRRLLEVLNGETVLPLVRHGITMAVVLVGGYFAVIGDIQTNIARQEEQIAALDERMDGMVTWLSRVQARLEETRDTIPARLSGIEATLQEIKGRLDRMQNARRP